MNHNIINKIKYYYYKNIWNKNIKLVNEEHNSNFRIVIPPFNKKKIREDYLSWKSDNIEVIYLEYMRKCKNSSCNMQSVVNYPKYYYIPPYEICKKNSLCGICKIQKNIEYPKLPKNY